MSDEFLQAIDNAQKIALGNLLGKDDELIAMIQPAQFEIFIKILDIFTKDKNTNSVIIKDSIISQFSYGAILRAKIASIFEDKVINFHITNPKKNLNLFKILQKRKDSPVFIINNTKEPTYTITNKIVRYILPKQVESLVDSITLPFPNFSKTNLFCELILNKNQIDELSSMMKESTKNYVEYLIHNNNLKAIQIPEVGIYIFDQYVDDPDINKIYNNNVDFILRSSSFLAIHSENYDIKIGKLDSGVYFSLAKCPSGIIEIEIFENLELSTGDNILG